MNSETPFQDLEIFDIRSEPILKMEYLEYNLRTVPNTITKQSALFFLSVNRAYILINGALVDQTAFYLHLKKTQVQPKPETSKKILQNTSLKNIMEQLPKKEF